MRTIIDKNIVASEIYFVQIEVTRILITAVKLFTTVIYHFAIGQINYKLILSSNIELSKNIIKKSDKMVVIIIK
jgi:hypothetical protein